MVIVIIPNITIYTKCSNQFKFIFHTDDSTLSTCIPGDNVMGTAELINNERKCLNRWLKSNTISTNTYKTKYMLYSYNKHVNLPIMKICNNKIMETSVTKFLGIHHDKKNEFCKL